MPETRPEIAARGTGRRTARRPKRIAVWDVARGRYRMVKLENRDDKLWPAAMTLWMLRELDAQQSAAVRRAA